MGLDKIEVAVQTDVHRCYRVGVHALSSFHYPLRGQPINEEIREEFESYLPSKR